MKIDMHFHVLGNGIDIANVDNDVYFCADDNNHWFTRMLYNLIEGDLKRMEADLNRDGKISTSEYFKLIYKMLKTSAEIEGIVLLGLDAVFSPKTGVLNRKKTDLWVSNRFLANKVDKLNRRLQKESDPKMRKKRFFLGASVSPNRKDWESELEYVISKTHAVLMKWIPSTQHIHVSDRKHKGFYETLAKHRMPLLCHVGPEYSFPEGLRKKQLDYFRYLERPLECGVTVIAAHCATPVFPLIDKNVTKKFHRFMEKTNSGGKVRLWADTSALSLSTRLPLIPDVVNRFRPEWLVHGSDFPIPIDGWPHLPWVTTGVAPKEYMEILKTKNPLDRDVRIKRAHGFSDKILKNSKKVFRMA